MRFGSLFAGIGGFDLGLEAAGMQCAWQVEIDPYCQKILAKHWPEVKRYDDIKKINTDELAPVDLICGGFPCQPWSSAGKRRGKEDDRDLWPEMLRIIVAVRPTWVIGENVAGFIEMGFERTATDLEAQGYEVQAFVIPAVAVGAPHQRNRIWIVAHAGHNRRSAEQREQQKKWAEKFNSSGTRNVADTPSQLREWHRDTWPGRQESSNQNWWEAEPDVGRVVDGIPNRVDRLKCLGNSVVPQIVYELGKAIKHELL